MSNLPEGAGPGRPKGLPNKATQKAREAIAMFVDGNSHRLQDWLDKIAEQSPEKAFNLFQSVIEYHVPKLQRNTHVGYYLSDAKGGNDKKVLRATTAALQLVYQTKEV